ncbi:MAG TPA: hypothetical protein VNS29_04110 [Burkholderiaceae bacterium]|nr:hypothetical protein [Burkholderiaceae bacterium]
MKILAETMNRLIGPGGVYSSNASASAAAPGVSRSTFDRIRNGGKIGASAISIDKLDGVAKAFGLEVWQLFVPKMDISQPPVLASETQISPAITPEEKKLLDAFRKLSSKERDYLLADAKKYLSK